MTTISLHSHNMHSFAPTDAPCSLRPMKIVEQADRLMNQAQVLYEKYEHIIGPTDRTVAEGKMTIAEDCRHGMGEKSWLAKAAHAKLYLNKAQEALDTVKKYVNEAVEIRSQKEGVLVVRRSGTWEEVL